METPCCCFHRLRVVDVIELTTSEICPDELRARLIDPAAGAYCGFEGWIRNHNEGQSVGRSDPIYVRAQDLALVSE